MILLTTTSILGGLLTSIALSSWIGATGAVLLAPVGGSLAALAAACALAMRRQELVGRRSLGIARVHPPAC
jgi:hypothetical protein